MRIALVTRSLTRGGAQTQVAVLAEGLMRRGHAVSVTPFYAEGPLRERIEVAGVPVIRLGKSGRWNLLAPIKRLSAHLRSTMCEVAYAFLPMENLLGLVAARLSGTAIVWGIRGAAVNRTQHGYASRLLYGIQFALIRQPDAVISNSRAALDEQSGRRLSQAFVVPNGIDCGRFIPEPTRRSEYRARYRLSNSVPLIGIVARLDPMKDHVTFLRAAAILKQQVPAARFLIAGDGPTAYRNELETTASALGVASDVLWLGDVTDPEHLYNALDVVVSSSAYGEGFSNTIGEALACGRPVVVTNIGDSARIVGDVGGVVEPRNPQALAEAIRSTVNSDTEFLQDRRRARIVEEFGVDAMVTRTEAILRGVVERRAAAGAPTRAMR